MSDERAIAEKILEVAITRIQKGWTQGALARDYLRTPLLGNSREAVCWCLMGSLSFNPGWSYIREYVVQELWIEIEDRNPGFTKSVEELYGSLNNEPLVRNFQICSLWNDLKGRTKEEVLEVLTAVQRKIKGC